MTRVELLDAWIVSAVNAYSGTSYPEGPCLFVEATGSEEVVLADLELVQAIAEAEGATDVVHERDPDARARLWKARHDAAHATAARFPGTKERATDVCVPLTELAGAARFARAEIDRLGLNAGIVGHAGDGNLHIAVQVDPARDRRCRRSSSTTSSTTRSLAAARAPASTASASARSGRSSRSTAT